MNLVKIGDTYLEKPQIVEDTYSVTYANEVTSSECTLDGVLHEAVSPHARHIITFSTWMLDEDTIQQFLALFSDNFIDENSRRISITYFDPNTATENTGIFKVSDAYCNVLHISNKVYYRPIEVTLTEY